MSDFDVFDRRLVDALRAYAVDAPTLDDPAAFARAIASGHPRRSAWAALAGVIGGRRLVWVLLAALLSLAAVLALAGSGAFREPVSPGLPMPDELFGFWRGSVNEAGPAVQGGEYELNFHAASLLSGPDGRPLEWAGLAAAVTSTRSGGIELVVRADESCGSGTYSLGIGTPDVEAPPAPSASGGNPTPVPGRTMLQRIADGEDLVLVPITDDCADRVSILTSGPWRTVSLTMTGGETYESVTFSEPFRFVMPALEPNVPGPSARPWGKGIFRVGNGFSWTSFFLDDVSVAVAVCDESTGMLADIPATPEAVGAWLRASGRSVSDQRELTVDGRTALAFEINGDGCGIWTPPLSRGEFYYGFRLYAIPTGDDTILYSVWSDEGSLEYVKAAADEIVRSMTFEP